MTGSMISLYEIEMKNFFSKIKFSIIWFLLIVLLLLPLVHLPKGSGLIYIPFCCALLGGFLLKSIDSTGTRWGEILLNPIIQWVGRISYSAYWWQEIFTLHPSIFWTPCGILVCSAISYYFIEKPFNKIGRNYISSSSCTKSSCNSGIISSPSAIPSF